MKQKSEMTHSLEALKKHSQTTDRSTLGLWDSIRADFEAVFEKDPAASSWLEVLTCYPGLQAVTVHRLAHILYRHRLFWLSRFISYIVRWLTGIDIHPGATLGRGIFIDHGTGVVIGQTAIVGDGTLIYQGVTLGGTGKQLGKRHPTLGKNVIVGAGAKILGDIEIGDNSRVGAGSVVLQSVPNDCTVVGIPGRIVRQFAKPISPLAHSNIPDPVANVVDKLIQRIDELEIKLNQLQQFREMEFTEKLFCQAPAINLSQNPNVDSRQLAKVD